MENIEFRNLIEFVDFVRSFDIKLGSGLEGTCYKKGNMSYKLYNSYYRWCYDKSSARRELLRFKNINIDNFYFIKNLIMVNGEVFGTGCEYANGNDCFDILLHRRKLDNIINALSILKSNIMEFSKNHIYIKDLCLENILYDGKVFRFIDNNDSYTSSDDVSVIYRENMKIVIRILFGAITNIKDDGKSFIYDYLMDIGSEFRNYMNDIDMLLNPDQTIIEIRNLIQEGIGREIVSFSNSRRELLKIRKR